MAGTFPAFGEGRPARRRTASPTVYLKSNVPGAAIPGDYRGVGRGHVGS